MTVTAYYLRMVSYNTLSYAYINTCNSNERVCMTTSVRSRYQELMANNRHLLGVTRHLAPHKLDWITTTIRQEAVQLTHTCDVYVACASAEYHVTVTVIKQCKSHPPDPRNNWYGLIHTHGLMGS